MICAQTRLSLHLLACLRCNDALWIPLHVQCLSHARIGERERRKHDLTKIIPTLTYIVTR